MSNLGTLLGDLIKYSARFPPPSRTFRTVSSHLWTPYRSDRYSGVAHVSIDSVSALSTFPLNHTVSPVHGSQSLHGGLRSHGGSKLCFPRCYHTCWLFCIASGLSHVNGGAVSPSAGERGWSASPVFTYKMRLVSPDSFFLLACLVIWTPSVFGGDHLNCG